MENIVAIIAQVGFPKQETDKLTEALNNNTQALIKLAERLDNYSEQEGKH